MKTLFTLISWIVGFSLILALPFLALVRGSVFLYHDQEWFTYPALFGGIGLAVLVVSIYLWALKRMLGFKKSKVSLKTFTGFAFILVILYTLFTTFLTWPENAKNAEVRSEFYDLHPLLRLGTGTLIFIDKDLLVTDLSRKPSDYKRMGLPHKGFSLHFIQEEDGYAHALDLRTKGRSETANFLIETYFNLMGFRTLRHVGTADHLHVSLAPHSKPNAL